MKKITFCFLAKSKKCHWARLPKRGQKLNFSWKCHYFPLLRKPKVIFFTKKSLFVYWPCQKNITFGQSWVFGPFLVIWLSDIFLTRPENKKWIFSQRNYFLFSEQCFFLAGKIGCSTTPKLFWKILLLRPDVEDFKTLFFCTSMWCPLML